MAIKLSQKEFKQLMKETIEDVGLANAMNIGLMTKPVVPTLKINTNLASKARLEFHESFFNDFDKIEDKEERDG